MSDSDSNPEPIQRKKLKKSSQQKENQVSEWKKWRQEKKQEHKLWKEQRSLKKLKKKEKLELAANKLKETEVEENIILNENTNTVAIAIPGSILDNAQSPELRTYLAGQIARAACVFRVDEIIIFDETCSSVEDENTTEGEYKGIGKKGKANVQMARILQYLECPQYLRKYFFPMHKDLQYAGLLNPLDAPHHLRANDDSLFREGVIIDRPIKEGKGSYVNIGLVKDIQIDKVIQTGVRVTVKLNNNSNKKHQTGVVVSPSTPREEAGLYWGYSVRLASSLNEVFKNSQHEEGYDLMIGTSDKGDSIEEISLKKFKNLLIVFGGLKGLEYSIEADEHLSESSPTEIFHHYINSCPKQGSKTIRTEEAILITLSSLQFKLSKTNSSKI